MQRTARTAKPFCFDPARFFVALARILSFLTIVGSLFSLSSVKADQFGISRRFGRSPYSASRIPAFPTPVPVAAETPDPLTGLPGLSGPSAVPATSNPKIGSRAAPFESSSARTRPQNGLPTNNASAPLPNVVRLIAFDRGGQSFGSGSYIGKHGEYGLILSNWHVVCETDGLVHVHFPNGFSSFGAVVLSDKKWDLATIAVSKPPEAIPPLPIAQSIPKQGDPLWIAGHGSGSYRLAGGHCVRYLAPEIPSNGSAPLYEIVELSVSARQGDSGGPILNRNGELAGVLFGSDMIRNTAGSYCERVNRFLEQTKPYLDRLPEKPEMHFASVEPSGPFRRLHDSVHAMSAENPASTSPRRGLDFGGSASFGIRSPSRRYAQPSAPAAFQIHDKPVGRTPESATSREGVPAEHSAPTSFQPPAGANRAHETGQADRAVQTAVWEKSQDGPRYGSLGTSLDRSFRSHRSDVPIVQAAHHPARNEAVGNHAGLMLPDPFVEDRSALNPESSSLSARSGADGSGASEFRLAIPSEKYGRATFSVPKNHGVESGGEANRGLTAVSERDATVVPFGWIGVFAVGGLVCLALRLLRSDKSKADDSDFPMIASNTFPKRDRESNAA